MAAKKEKLLSKFWYDFNNDMIYYYIVFNNTWKMVYLYIKYKDFINEYIKNWKAKSYKKAESLVKNYFINQLKLVTKTAKAEFEKIYRTKILNSWLDIMVNFHKQYTK